MFRFKAPRPACLGLFLGLLLWAPAAPVRAGALWPLGRADARLIQAGWRRDPKTGDWSAEVELRLVNRDLRRVFHSPVRVEFVDAGGRAWVWKTFVTLAPGTAQHRSIEAPRRLNFSGPLAECPALGVRVDLKTGEGAVGLQMIPRTALDDPEAPPAGSPLYVAAVEDGAVLRLIDGRRVRPLGVRCAKGSQSAEAAAWTRGQVMDAPVSLAYDGFPKDMAGRWFAYVTLPDGRDLGAELLKRSLAALDGQAAFSRLEAYRSLASKAPKRAKAS
jgi:endonuclease YncB( thermonuclease family)